MLVIRLNRVGKNRRAQFRVVAQEHTIAPGGKHVEVLGSYDPQLKKAVLKADRIKYWISQGAQVSDSAYNLFIREKVIEGKKREKKIKKSVVEAKAEEAKTEAVAEVPAEEVKAEKKTEEPKTEEAK